VIYFSSAPHLNFLFLLHLLFLTLRLTFYLSLITTNPSSEPNRKRHICGRLRVREEWGEPRFCSSCKKLVPGLDHHCTWLNTCVGEVRIREKGVWTERTFTTRAMHLTAINLTLIIFPLSVSV